MTLTVSVSDIVEDSSEPLLAKHPEWERVRLDNVATILNGYAFASKHFSKELGVPLLRIRDVGESATECRYGGEYDERYLVMLGDLVVGMDGDFKCARWSGPAALLNQRVCKITIDTTGYVPRFLELALPGYLDAIGNRTSSQTVKHLSSSSLAELPLPLPPLGEQQRIVTQLDELLSHVNCARLHLSSVPAILERFRQAVLAAACSGRLTEDWRELNKVSEDATYQLERMQVERREHFAAANGKRKYREPDAVLEEDLPQIPETWCWTNFDHCSWEITVGHVGPMRDRYVAKGIRFLRCQNVRPLHFDPHGLVHIPPDFHAQLSKSKLSGGEILVVRSGANTGDCCVFPHNLAPANCSDLVITRPLSGLCAEYGAFYVSSPNGQARLTFNETGIAQPHFNIGAMRVKAFPLPPLAEQREIIGRVEALFRLADAIEERVAFASLRADKLTQSILAKAFRGELVSTEAELARREGRDYEPASALLERIKAEKASLDSGKALRSKRPAPRSGKRRTVSA